MKIFLTILITASAAWGQSVYTGTSTSAGSATWGSSGQSGLPCGPPAYLCSRSDTVLNSLVDPNNTNAKHPPLLAAPGQSTACGRSQCWGGNLGSGVVAADSFYNGNRMLRVTDSATNVANDSYVTRSSAETTQTNYDGSVFGVLERSSFRCLFSFDRLAWASPSCAAGGTSCQAATKQVCMQGPSSVPTGFCLWNFGGRHTRDVCVQRQVAAD